jgi:outer membrane receptor protein involved in Fe transport
MHHLIRPLARWVLIVLLAVLPAITRAQTPATGAIKGLLLDADSRTPLEGARVALTGRAGWVVTEADGSFVVADVPAGTHEITATIGGLRPVRVTAVEVTAGATTALKPIGLVAAPRGGRGESQVAAEKEKDLLTLDRYVVEGAKPKAYTAASTDLLRSREDAFEFKTFTARDIELSGASNLEEFLRNRLTQNTTVAASELVSDPEFPDGRPDTFSLRGWNDDDTVILVNGRRAPPRISGSPIGNGNGTAQATVNDVPIGSIERIEVLPTAGGAIYGAGATAGVINIITKRDYRGGQITARYEQPSSGSGHKEQYSFFASEPVRDWLTLRLTAQFSKALPMNESERGYYQERNLATISQRDPTQITRSKAITPQTVIPNIVVGSTVSATSGLFGAGTPVTTSVPAGYRGGQGLTPFLARQGVINTSIPGPADGVDGNNIGIISDTTTVGLGVRIDLPRRWDLEAEYQYYFAKGLGAKADPAEINVPATSPVNPFGQLVTVMLYDPKIAALNQRRRSTQERHQFNVTLRGEPFAGWRVLLDAAYSQTDSNSRGRNFVRPIDGTTTAAAFTAAMAAGRYNPFVDPHVVDHGVAAFYEEYVANLSRTNAAQRVYSARARLSGTAYRLPAGDLTVTGGGDFSRYDRFRSSRVTRNINSKTGDTIQTVLNETNDVQATQFFDRVYIDDTYAAYAESNIPVLGTKQQIPLVRRLELQVSGRVDQRRREEARLVKTNPANSLHVLALRWDATRDVAFTLSRSDGVKNPTSAQTAPAGPGEFLTNSTITDLRRANERYSTQVVAGGNPDLDPEQNTTERAGIVITPRFIRGLRLSTTWTDAKRTNAITSLSAQTLVNEEEDFPSRITRDTNGTPGRITLINRSPVNLNYVRSREIDYGLEQSIDHVFGGRAFLGVNATRHKSFLRRTTTTGVTTETIGNTNTGSNPGPAEWSANGNLRWEGRRWSFAWNTTYLDDQLLLLSATADINVLGRDRIEWTTLHDVVIEYRLDAGTATGWRRFLADTAISVGANNVFDRDGRYLPSSSNRAVPPSDSILGRTLWLRMRKSF